MTTIEVRRRLTADEVTAVLELVSAVSAHDGTSPLSEHVVLHLRHGGDDDVRHLLAHDTSIAKRHSLVGYAHLDVTDLVEGPSGELAVLPDHRRTGVGHLMIEAMISQAGQAAQPGRLRLWAHGDSVAAERLAESMGFVRSRVLWQMRRSLYSALEPVRLPGGVTLRSFRPGRDEHSWVDLNAEAFAHLPDQGAWTLSDLQRRMAEPWFDPAGFLVAEDAEGKLVGFHWTKVHGGLSHAHGDGSPTHHHEPIGEVYVVGVATAWQRTGLGRALTVAGLRHLREAGLGQAMLYVDAENTRAIRLYESLGFTRWDTDVLYRLDGP